MTIIPRIQRFGVALLITLMWAGAWMDSALGISIQDSFQDGFDAPTSEVYRWMGAELVTEREDGVDARRSPFPQTNAIPPEGWPSEGRVQRSTLTLLKREVVKQGSGGYETVVHHTQQQVTNWTTQAGVGQTQTLFREWTETLTQADPDGQTAQSRITTDDSAEIQCAPLPIASHDGPEANRRPLVLQPCLDASDTDNFLGQPMEGHGEFFNT